MTNAGETLESVDVAQRNLSLAGCETLAEPRLLHWALTFRDREGWSSVIRKHTPVTSPSGR